MTTQEKTPAGGNRAGASENFSSRPQFSRKSTKTEAQEERILAALRERPQTTDDLRKLGCYQVSARIFGLRAQGWNITTELFDGYAADGMSHARMARYTLAEGPQATLPLVARRSQPQEAGRGPQ